MAFKAITSKVTSSSTVQEAIANCLPPLVLAIKEQVPQLVEKLLCLLLEASQYGERKGAAFGLAGLVKGMGILSLRQLDIMTRLTDAVTDKKSAKHREESSNQTIRQLMCKLTMTFFTTGQN
uniref:Uncharacterized protein n=1 Tax=Romanomermis culicivorax TaxID=13658 RepID=A0A915IHQ8_ROMCU